MGVMFIQTLDRQRTAAGVAYTFAVFVHRFGMILELYNVCFIVRLLAVPLFFDAEELR